MRNRGLRQMKKKKSITRRKKAREHIQLFEISENEIYSASVSVRKKFKE